MTPPPSQKPEKDNSQNNQVLPGQRITQNDASLIAISDANRQNQLDSSQANLDGYFGVSKPEQTKSKYDSRHSKFEITQTQIHSSKPPVKIYGETNSRRDASENNSKSPTYVQMKISTQINANHYHSRESYASNSNGSLQLTQQNPALDGSGLNHQERYCSNFMSAYF